MPERFATVDAFLDAQTPERRAEVGRMRSLVHEAEPALVEVVKWNSPSWTLDGVDRLTVSAAGKGPVLLVLHFGTERAEQRGAAPAGFAGDPEGLLRWRSDIRATLETPTAAELPERRDALVAVIRAWLAER
ncbi:DUF1801 domain-containing protein [Agrococcus beijingensis]|uniref:DUF1801 domain-containing protein n=1 Tax=Agrococcus beijingensis TaxID=3068634 RepID=UPI00274178AD|nr:DUF1801 domain-containing protein [Agrococcus sp. REN33]